MTYVMNDELGEDFHNAIVKLLERRDPGKTICPSEASKAVFGEKIGNEKEFMDGTRAVVRAMVDEGMIEVCQQGEVVNMDNGKGPVRLRRKI